MLFHFWKYKQKEEEQQLPLNTFPFFMLRIYFASVHLRWCSISNHALLNAWSLSVHLKFPFLFTAPSSFLLIFYGYNMHKISCKKSIFNFKFKYRNMLSYILTMGFLKIWFDEFAKTAVPPSIGNFQFLMGFRLGGKSLRMTTLSVRNYSWACMLLCYVLGALTWIALTNQFCQILETKQGHLG